jgi:hypothetical protein
MNTITTNPTTELGDAKQVVGAIKADLLEAQANAVAEAKADLQAAKDAFAEAEANWLAVGVDEYVLTDGRKVTVQRSSVRSFDADMVKTIVGRGVWQRIKAEVIDTKAFDVEMEGGRIDASEIASAISHKDRKPSVRVK